MEKQMKSTFIAVLAVAIITSSLFGSIMGFWAGSLANSNSLMKLLGLDKSENAQLEEMNQTSVVKSINEESAVIDVVDHVSPAVVSIIVSKDLPILERYYNNPFGDSGSLFEEFFGDDFGDLFGFGIPQYRQKGTQKQEVGGGTGFLINSEGYIITNKHVVLDEEAEYTVLMNDEQKYDAKVLARDPFNDLAVLKIEGKDFPSIELGDSTNLKVGQSVVAIGNALGEFRNTVSTGVISGLSRSITAGGLGSQSEQLTGVIQTDASINPGNSGGPLLNIAGQVIGINTAIVRGAQNIGFAIPINEVKSIYESVKEHGRIVRPWLGVRYVMINDLIKEKNKLDVDYGALIVRGEERTDLAVLPGSPADKAGLRENDIILEIDNEKIDSEHPLAKAVAQKQPGDEINLKILRKGEEQEVKVKLEEMKE